jgi:hypothetical protein
MFILFMSALSTNGYQFFGESLRFEKKKSARHALEFFCKCSLSKLSKCQPYSLPLLRVEYGLGEIL